MRRVDRERREKTSTATNDDDPGELIVIKHAMNDSGGTTKASDFTMNVTATKPELLILRRCGESGHDDHGQPGQLQRR